LKKFKKSFTQQESLPIESISNAVDILNSGRLHRYNTLENEESQTTLFEKEYSKYQGVKYCLSCTSGGYALFLALCSLQIKNNEPILTNSFTLSPVPGAIVNAGGQPILVDTTYNLKIDLDDLIVKIKKFNPRILLLSHMRGHIVDMDELCEILNKYKLILIEDCAHTMGASWGNIKSGNYGFISCFSTQTYKHLNSGEGGIITTNDPDTLAKCIFMSGSYMFYEKHFSEINNNIFKKYSETMPNFSGRMDNLRSSILRPQLKNLEKNCKKWNYKYNLIYSKLKLNQHFSFPLRNTKENFVGSSIQFYLNNFKKDQIKHFIKECSFFGVDLKWFGDDIPKGYTSNYSHWKYINNIEIKNTSKYLDSLIDMRIPLTFSDDDCKQISEIINYCSFRVKI